MIPMVLIVATDSVYKCITTQGATTIFFGEFQSRFVMQIFCFLNHGALRLAT